MALVDAFNRKIDYLRISITDHCNLNCKYCSPPFSARARLERQEILTYEEIATLAEAAVAAGIRRIRLTGGEPLIRKGVVDLCRMLIEIDGLDRELSRFDFGKIQDFIDQVQQGFSAPGNIPGKLFLFII